MPTIRFDIDKDARIGTDGSLNLGAGACNHLPWGAGGGFTYQSLFKLSHRWSEISGADVSSVRVYFRNSDQNHLTRGGAGDRQFMLAPITTSWSPGSASHPMTTSNAVVWGGITANGTYATGPHGTSDTTDGWNDFDCTESFRWSAPSHITFPGGAGLGNDNRGFRIARNDSADKGEFWSEEKGSNFAIYAIVTYTIHGDIALDVTAPVSGTGGGGTYAAPSVTFAATASCPEGHSITGYNIQSAQDSAFASSVTTDHVENPLAEVRTTDVVRGVTNYFKVRAYCTAGEYSEYSDVIEVFVPDAALPVIIGAADQVMELDIEGAETNPRAIVRWTYSDPAGFPQLQYRAILYADDGVTALEDSGWQTSSATLHRFSTYASIARGTHYKYTVETRNTYSISAGVTAMARRKAQWGLYNMYKSLGVTPTSWRFTSSTTEPTNTRIVFQHSSSGSTTPGTWDENIDEVAFNTYYHVRFWLFAWHGATTPSVTAYSVWINSGAVLSADKWTLATGASLSQAKFVLGSRSLKMACTTSTTRISYSDTFVVKPGTTYILSGRAFSVGNSGGYVRVTNASRNQILASTDALTATTGTIPDTSPDDFQHLESPSFTTGASQSTVVVECIVTGNTGNECYFDCVQLEPGTVVSAYRPGQIGLANVVDMGGVQIDAYSGGTFRLRGSDGDSNAVTELGDKGLEMGVITMRELATPPTTADAGKPFLYFKTDGKLYKRLLGVESEVGAGGGFTDPMTTRGDIITRGASAAQRLALGSARRALVSNGTDALWGYIGASPLVVDPVASAITTNTAAAGTWYRVATADFHETFTADYIGQKFFVIIPWFFSRGGGTGQISIQVGAHIRTNTSPPATQVSAAGAPDICANVAYADPNGTGNHSATGFYVYTAGATGTHNIYAYVRGQGTVSGTWSVKLAPGTQMVVLPLPASS